MALKFLPSEQEWFNNAIRYFSGDEPVFLARIGGSDTEAAVAYFISKSSGIPTPRESLKRYKDLVRRYNGYYDPTDNDELYFRYCDVLLKCYHDARQLVFCNYQLLSLYFKQWIHEQFYREEFDNKEGYTVLVESIGASAHVTECYPYPFIERLVIGDWTMFRAFSKILPGKKVLVISPFASSIETNWGNRNHFLRDYEYPEFDLVTYNTPITYSGLSQEFYPDANWHESLARMQNEISKIDFDIALLACGSYALPLGDYIANQCRRHAIYIGGVLQIYFGVMGRRYDNPFFLDQIHVDKFIRPIEGQQYLKFTSIDENTAREALGAYF